MEEPMELTEFEATIAKSIQQLNTELPSGTPWVLVVSETASETTTHLARNASNALATQMVDKSLAALRDPNCVLPPLKEPIAETIVRFDATLPHGTLWVLALVDRASGPTINIARNVPDARAIEMLDEATTTLREPELVVLAVCRQPQGAQEKVH
jgi:hypothetical protein